MGPFFYLLFPQELPFSRGIHPGCGVNRGRARPLGFHHSFRAMGELQGDISVSPAAAPADSDAGGGEAAGFGFCLRVGEKKTKPHKFKQKERGGWQGGWHGAVPGFGRPWGQ